MWHSKKRNLKAYQFSGKNYRDLYVPWILRFLSDPMKAEIEDP
jgi:hypothetical protein